MGGGEESSILSLSTVVNSQGSHAWPADSSSVFCFGTNVNGVCSGRTQICYCQQLLAHFSHKLCCSFQAPLGLVFLSKKPLKQQNPPHWPLGRAAAAPNTLPTGLPTSASPTPTPPSPQHKHGAGKRQPGSPVTLDKPRLGECHC